jgi:hypothetical protein
VEKHSTGSIQSDADSNCRTVETIEQRRRYILVSGITFLTLLSFARAQTSDVAPVTLRVEQQALLRIPLSVRKNLSVQEDHSSDAQALGREVPPTHAIPIFFLVAGILAAPIVYDAILEMVRETVYGGVIMDLRNKPPIITNSRAIPAGIVEVIKPDGSTESRQSQSFMLETLDAWLRLGRKVP